MKRKEIIERFEIKDSFLNLMITRATVLKSLKAGMGYANEYDEKDVCLILIGWEMHKLGVSFRYINKVLSTWKSIPSENFKIYFTKLRKDYEILCIQPQNDFAEASKQKQDDDEWIGWTTKKKLMNWIKSKDLSGFIFIDVKQITEKVY